MGELEVFAQNIATAVTVCGQLVAWQRAVILKCATETIDRDVSIGTLGNPTRTSVQLKQRLLSFWRRVTGVDNVTHRPNPSRCCLFLHERLLERSHTHGFTSFLQLLVT